MDTARTLQSDHPEVTMYGRRCLGDAAGLFDKAKAFAEADNDQMAIKVRKAKSRRACAHAGNSHRAAKAARRY